MIRLLGNKLVQGRLSLYPAGTASVDGEGSSANPEPSPSQKLPERISTRILHRGDCWLWTSDRNSAGFGEVYYRGQMRPAHRVVYELLQGPTPALLTHACGTHRCVNPDHLEVTE